MYYRWEGAKVIFYRNSISILLTFLICSFLSCKYTTIEPVQELAVSVNPFILSPNEPINIVLYNGTNSPAYFGSCNDRLTFSLEQKTGNTWIGIGGVNFSSNCFLVGITSINSGVTYRDTIIIVNPGVYRLKFPFGWDVTRPDNDSLLSNQFTIYGNAITRFP